MVIFLEFYFLFKKIKKTITLSLVLTSEKRTKDIEYLIYKTVNSFDIRFYLYALLYGKRVLTVFWNYSEWKKRLFLLNIFL